MVLSTCGRVVASYWRCELATEAVALAAVAVAAAVSAGCGTGQAGTRPPEGRGVACAVREASLGPAVRDIAIAGPGLALAAGTIGLGSSADDSGRTWRRLRLPGWSLSNGGLPVQGGDLDG